MSLETIKKQQRISYILLCTGIAAYLALILVGLLLDSRSLIRAGMIALLFWQ